MKCFLKRSIKNIEVNTRFAPEPSYYLHLGHLKCICVNHFFLKNRSMLIRFDDTNPITSKKKYVIEIKKDLLNLGIETRINYTSDYFKKLIKIAKIFIKKKSAYIEYSGVRINSISKNIKIFKLMYNGRIKEKRAVLKSNIKTITKNYNVKLNIMYRILNHKHYRKKNYIYPTYNFSHCLCDLFENINYSFCSNEFKNNSFIYSWYINEYTKHIEKPKNLPKQIEFSRLKIDNVLLSKRRMKKNKLKNNLLTIRSLINRGIDKNILIDFCKNLSYTSEKEISLEHFSRFVINKMSTGNFLNIIFKPIKIYFYGKKYIEKNKAKKKTKRLFYIKNIVKRRMLINNILGKKNFTIRQCYFYAEKKYISKICENDTVYIISLGIFKLVKNIFKEVITF
ncbi:glutamate--tRNA ligase family protein [Candidatus Vidania fulgoroideorum]